MGGGGGGVFGGSTGITRLFNSALGPQVSWLLGFALVGGAAVAFFSKLRPSNANTGWIIAIGGTFVTIALAFSFASGIFHPYYSSQLAPFTAMLVGGGIGAFTAKDSSEASDATRRYWLAGGLVAGLISTLWVLQNASGDNLGTWQAPLALIVLGSAAAIVFGGMEPKIRDAALIASVMALLVAPAIWSVQTLGHATSGTFPAGGSAPGPAGAGWGAPGGAGRPSGAQRNLAGPSAGASNTGGPPSGGMAGGGNNSQVTAAIAYSNAHGGGTIGVESQMTASSSIASSGAQVAGIGGFSGRESTVSISWLADAVADGRLTYFVTGGNSQGMGNDGRAGSTSAMDAVAKVCTAVTLDTTASTTSTSSGFYDCTGKAAQLKALA
jgi:hypothetical protein